jgi:hypothetical protein
MTPMHLAIFAYVLVFAGSLCSSLVELAFCVEPSPRWMRVVRTLALSAAMVRATIATAFNLPPEWWGAGLWLILGGAAIALAVHNLWRSARMGDRCR